MDIAREHNAALIPAVFASNLQDDHAAGRLTPGAPQAVNNPMTWGTPGPSFDNNFNAYHPPKEFLVNNKVVTRWQCNPQVQVGDKPRNQHTRAYNLWYTNSASLDHIRGELRSPSNPLAKSTVMYVIVLYYLTNDS